ncbi:GRIP and coiled-coil domain-containing protein 1-like [Hydractinia symbiolongicarpus]|uniref:GRIP and coiled-coil domain-containing protein 1-like n=1 Tax=Hydractinia symbiolongicarpus TaxID=13093 RepID=UPI00254EB1D9|nr:GRIP and coiled-coil domain-containing protein 1-like [Hydractinia symbiolongicarpus]XP_057289789.1 GRIP and coiled-coil domain-containing protein 1-like [Hydractinia symbiolongicarpus]
MDKYTYEELLHHCEKLTRKLSRYETRFSALVEAYKNLLEEKQVLETTLKTLSSKPQKKTAVSQNKETSESSKVKSDPLGALQENFDTSTESISNETQETDKDTECSQDELIKSLEEKVTALSTALQSMAEGKNKMEIVYQADKKAMLAEHKAQIAKLEEENTHAVKLQNEIRGKLCQEQSDRESEEKNYASMMKELQELVAAERLEKNELKTQLTERELIISNLSEKQHQDYQDSIQQLTDELDLLKLKHSEEDEKRPENIIKGLADQVEQIKIGHVSNLEIEQTRAKHAEEILKSTQEHEEQRIAELESRLSELSVIVGSYDKQRQEDQAVIRRLRERLENLEDENSALSSTQNSLSNNESKIEELQDQVTKLRNLLKMAWKKADRHLDLQILSNSEIDDILKNDPTHHACRAEYKQLKDEFEGYKRKLRNNKVSKDDHVSEDINDYKTKIEKLQTDMKNMEEHFEEKEKESISLITKLQIDITCTKENYELQLESLREDHKKNIEQLDTEIHKQRIRTVDLLQEKDTELERLQKIVFDREDLVQTQSIKQRCSVNDSFLTSDLSFIQDEPCSVEEMLVQSPTSPTGHNLFHYTEQISHYESELSLCRSQLIDLQSDVRDAEHREEQSINQMQALKEEIRNLERGRSRESANLEYLKNVCLQFMLTDSPSVKKQMSHAISTILTFSPAEMVQVQKKQNLGWW